MISELSLKVWAREAIQTTVYPSTLFPPSYYYRFFRVLAANIKPKLSVVLGVCGGGDCLHLALGNPEGKVIGIDIQRDHEIEIQYIEKTCSNFLFYKGDSVKSAKFISKTFGNPQIVFIDTIHELQRTIDEFNAWKPYLAENYIIAFDDLLREEMKGFWEWVPEPKLRLDELHPTAEGGFGVCWK